VRVVYAAEHLGHDPDLASFYGTLQPVVEAPERAETIRRALEADPSFDVVGASEHGAGPITEVHDPGLIRFLDTIWEEWAGDPAAGAIPRIIPEMFWHPAVTDGMGPPPEQASIYGRQAAYTFDASTPIVAGTALAARAAVDVALTAADAVAGGETTAYGLCRPPGHHAARGALGGFCYLNNAAIAAEYLAGRMDESIAILDVDYHHGNGTQQIFWERGDVLYASLHGDPARAYPYLTGYPEERGSGDGEGATINVPLEPRVDDTRYLDALAPVLERIAGFPGSICVVSLGFDTYRLDPICDLALTTEGYHRIGAAVAATGKQLVILQEGGYHVGDIGANARAWLRGAAGLPPG
jgi:acetoin utilization deacetylase AcuC-like enzyme